VKEKAKEILKDVAAGAKVPESIMQK